MNMCRIYEYKEFTLIETKDVDDDVVKIFHDVDGPSCHVGFIKFTPYESISEEFFEHWIDAGLPLHPKSGGNWRNSDIDELKRP